MADIYPSFKKFICHSKENCLCFNEIRATLTVFFRLGHIRNTEVNFNLKEKNAQSLFTAFDNTSSVVFLQKAKRNNYSTAGTAHHTRSIGVIKGPCDTQPAVPLLSF